MKRDHQNATKKNVQSAKVLAEVEKAIRTGIKAGGIVFCW